FNRCYFRGVIFTSCDFTSSRFIDCNFKGAKFIHCKFNYATFRRTIVESGEIIANLPYEPNVRRDLLRNLRVDARELGSVEEESLYIQHEIEASDLFSISAF
ncbi:pentapeptide repeat-containing protein, partial [Pseudomonas viridiflava]|uniref:pentapeptide repeat-containing protein n=1 Tax=Pseudomonas viridiflava TaxID=33069 RepID=UPI0019D24ABE